MKDKAGKDRIGVFSPVIQVDDHSDYEQQWKDFIFPHLENAARQNPDAGRIQAACIPASSDSSRPASQRQKIMAMGRRGGALVTEVPFELGFAHSDEGSLADDDGSEIADRSGDDASSRGEDRDGDESAATGRSDEEKVRYVRVAMSPPPSGYGDWRRMPSSNYHNFVTVYYAQKVDKDEVRVLWRCVNESSIDVSCSIGAGKDKAYHCDLPGMRMETTRSLGERATVRSGRFYTFPSDWACRGLGASGVRPNVDVRIEPL